MNKISLRAATENDYSLMYQIKENSIKPYVERVWGWEENFQHRFLRENTRVEEVSFILYEDKVAGFIEKKENDNEIFIGSLFVTNDFQNKGIGTYLLKENLKQNKIVSLEVLKINTGAFNLYKKMNFVVWKEDELKYFMKHEPNKSIQMKNILDKIVERKFEEVAEAKQKVSEAELQHSSMFQRKTISLKASLLDKNKTGIIAEFKRASPSKGIINSTAKVEDVTKSYTENGASCLSVLTDKDFFHGSLDDLKIARQNNIPILRKDFMIDEYQILEARANGADVILLIAACLNPNRVKELATYAKELSLEVLLEIHGDDELDCVCEEIDFVGVNNRNLKTFEVDIENSIRLLNKLPKDKLTIAESGIENVDVVKQLRNAGFKGFLIGENFMKHENPGEAFKNYVQQLKAIEREN